LRNPHAAMRGFNVGGLGMNPMIIVFVIVWLLTSRGHNHAVLIEEHIILMHCIINNMKVNWVHVMKEHMIKSKKLTNFNILYVVLVSKMIEYFRVELDGELTKIVKLHNEITTTIVHNTGIKEINNDY